MYKLVLKVAIFVVTILLIASCVSRPAIQSASLEQYLITVKDLPPNWTVSIPPERFTENYGQDSDWVVEFKNGNHVSHHLVLAYNDTQKAVDNYKHLVPAFLHVTTATIKPPYPPKDINFSTSIAQEFTLKCELLEFTPNEVCTYIAVYGDKVVVFTTHLAPEVMSSDDLEKVLSRIDKKMLN